MGGDWIANGYIGTTDTVITNGIGCATSSYTPLDTPSSWRRPRFAKEEGPMEWLDRRVEEMRVAL